MPEMTLMLYCERASSRPARKATSERERPRALVSRAMPIHRPSVVSSSISRLREPMTASMRRSRPKCAARSTAPSDRATQRQLSRASCRESCNVPASRGTASSMGAIMISWNTRIASERRPVGVQVLPRSCMMRRTMADEESAARQPQKTPFCQLTPCSRKMPVTASTVSPICRLPPRKTGRLSLLRASPESSMPMVKSSMATPSSAT